MSGGADDEAKATAAGATSNPSAPQPPALTLSVTDSDGIDERIIDVPDGLHDAPQDRDPPLLPPASPRSPALPLEDTDEPLPAPGIVGGGGGGGLGIDQGDDEGDGETHEPAHGQEEADIDDDDDIEEAHNFDPEDHGEDDEDEEGEGQQRQHDAGQSHLLQEMGTTDGQRGDEEAQPTQALAAPPGTEEVSQVVSGPAAPNGGQHQAAVAPQPQRLTSVSLVEGAEEVLHDGLDESGGLDQQQQQQQQQQQRLGPGGGPLDSISLGQLRNLVNFSTKPRTAQYAFPSDADADALPREIDEFFSYVEAPQTAENRAAWEEWSTGKVKGNDGEVIEEIKTEAKGIGAEWTSLPTSSRRRTIETLLSLLEVKDPMTRQRASRALLYLLQGSFADTKGPEHQLQWMTENARMVRGAGGLGEIYAALRLASWKHDWLSSLPDHIPSSEPAPDGGPAPAPLLTPRAKADYLDEINLELTLHFAQLYILVETHRGEEEWGDELMSLEPPLPIYLFGLVASLREKPAKGYPVKKLLLLLWKTMLSCFGGVADASRCKRLARELEGLPAEIDTKRVPTKATPNDFQSFQEEISVKYPTFQPPAKGLDGVPTAKIATAVAPIPPKRPIGQSQDGSGGGAGGEGGPGGFPGTPAPTPPASPKPSKQKYQTDQSRPFVFPYSRSVQGPRMVPYSIEEAGRLFQSHMHVSLEMWQLWRLREDFVHEESGVASDVDGTRIGPGVQRTASSASTSGAAERRKGNASAIGAGPGGRPGSLFSRFEDGAATASASQGSRSPTATEAGPSDGASTPKRFARFRGEPTHDRLVELEAELDAEVARIEADHMLAALDVERYTAILSRATQQRADVRRLLRVDQLYRAVLPHLHSGVIVLLKLLLATVNQQSTTNSPHAQAIAEGVPVEEAPPPTLEDIDIVRHREITSKAVSAILLLSLKWFKASHALKFHYLGQLLVDSNCLLLILKMFGLQEVANGIKSQNEAPAFNFFRYCELNCGREPRQPQPEDAMLAPQPVVSATSPNGGVANLGSKTDEIEYIHDFSFRNFFSALNFTRILQKLTKRKVHRILLLVQYKSSAILKRSLRVSHPALQLYVLKVIKSQVPFCGRKWRQSNMKVITAIYLNCRPDLREEWLSGSEVDSLVEESLPQEQALRALVKYYNATRYAPPSTAGPGHPGAHRRSISNAQAALIGGEGAPGANSDESGLPHGLMSPGRSAASFFESDMLPPLRRSAESTPGTLRYIPDDLLDLNEYEDVLSEVFGDGMGPGSGEADEGSGWSSGKWGLTQDGAQTAWARLGEILGDADSISDSESINTIGELDTEGAGGVSGVEGGSTAEGGVEPGATGWESLSPEAIDFLRHRPRTPGSPSDARHRRSSSSGGSDVGKGRSNSNSSPLRPVLAFGPELLSDSDVIVDDELEEPQPLPMPKSQAVDEVEAVFGD